MNTQYPQITTRVCPDCNSAILLTSRTVAIEEGQIHPVTTSTYECSNKVCSDAFKKREVQRRAEAQARMSRKHKRFMKSDESQAIAA